MNWYKKANQLYEDEDMMEYLDALLEEEMEGSDLDIMERLRIKEQVENQLSSFPPGYKLRKDINGWSVLSPEGNAVSLNEEQLIHSIPGGKARFDFMGQSV
jgi:hypothetical protein